VTSTTRIFYFSDGVDISANIDAAAGVVVPFGLGDRSVAGHSAETILHCDVIGDPAIYPDAWKKYGPPGTALTVHDDGTNLIPDGTSKNFKMSRKVLDLVLVIWSADAGVTWTVSTSSWSSVEGATNARTHGPGTGRVDMIFYTTKANPLELAVNAERLVHGDVWVGQRGNVVNAGVNLVSDLIGKVPVAAGGKSKNILPLLSVGMDENLKLTGDDINGWITHGVIDLSNESSPAAKVLNYFSRENGRAYLYLLYSEIVWDTSLDNGTEFTDVTGAATTAKVVDTWYHVTTGIRTGYWICRNGTSLAFDDSALSQSGEYLIYTDGNQIFQRWGGNGWGDNGRLTVLDNEDTELDDNGQTILIGTKRVELPFLIRGDE
jgi:hypothetical protein